MTGEERKWQAEIEDIQYGGVEHPALSVVREDPRRELWGNQGGYYKCIFNPIQIR